MKKISVVVPVYNTEKYLEKCLNSIVNQTYKNLEIIIVNDGSTDNSETIINRFINEYPTLIKYFKKANGGLSSARNYGVRQVTGDYISFVDSDDYLDLNLFTNLSPELETNIDLIKFKSITVDTNYKKIQNNDGPIFNNIDGETAFNKLVFSDVLLEPAWLYLYKTDFYVKNNFSFALNKYHEDFGLTPLILLKSSSVSSVNIYGYYYVLSNNSITRNKDLNKLHKSAYDRLFHYDNMLNQIVYYNISDTTKDNIKLYFSNSIFSTVKKIDFKERKHFISEIKQRHLLQNIKIKNFKQLIKKILFYLNIYF